MKSSQIELKKETLNGLKSLKKKKEDELDHENNLISKIKEQMGESYAKVHLYNKMGNRIDVDPTLKDAYCNERKLVESELKDLAEELNNTLDDLYTKHKQLNLEIKALDELIREFK